MRIEIDVDDVRAFCEERAKCLEETITGTDPNTTLYKSLYTQRWGSLQAFKDVIAFIDTRRDE